MTTAAIITEYNPFHNGHKYQIDKIKKLLHCDNIIIIMSGEFTQRGIPAICYKSVRTQIALECGADLVILLPVLFSNASAEIFSRGAVTILDELGCIDYLVYGIENIENNNIIKDAASIMTDESEYYNKIIKQYLSKGFSYPASCEAAFKEILNNEQYYKNYSDIFLPNNILALEYEKSLIKLNSNIKTFGIPRKGNGYSSTSLDSPYVSAAALRKYFCGTNFNKDTISEYMPDCAAYILDNHFCMRSPVFADDFSNMLLMKLINSCDDYSNYLDCSSDLSRKIIKNIDKFQSITQFVTVLKSKDYTYNRIMRTLFHIMLDIKTSDIENVFNNTNNLYARILGFDTKALPLLSLMKKTSKIPIVTNVKDGEKKLSKDALALYNKDIFASNLYIAMERNKSKIELKNEYQYQLIKI